MARPYTLSCHCGAVRFEVDAEPSGRAAALSRPALSNAENRAGRTWRDALSGHHFCPTCGTALMRTGYKDRVSLNARCLEGVDVFELKIDRYDGRREMP